MWISGGDYRFLQKRVLDLEKQLEQERTENRRREDWLVNMLLRRAGTFPIPSKEKTEQKEKPPSAPQPYKFSGIQLAQLKALREEAQRLGRPAKEADDHFEEIHGVRPPQ